MEAATDREINGESAWGNHIALIVEVDGERWLADVGSATWTWPVLLREGAQRQGPFVYRVERLDDDTWRVHRRPGSASFRSTDFRLTPVQIADYLDRHREIGTTSGPPYTDLIIQRPYDDQVVMLHSLTLTRRGPAVPDGYVRQTLSSFDEFADVLAEQFDLPVDDIGEPGIRTLWARASEQHQKRLARKGH